MTGDCVATSAGDDNGATAVIVDPPATPAPTPIAAIALTQLVGDFAQNADGSVGIYQAATPPLTFLTAPNILPGDRTKARARMLPSASSLQAEATARARALASEQAETAAAAALPAGYATAPPSLPEHNTVEADFLSTVLDLATGEIQGRPLADCIFARCTTPTRGVRGHRGRRGH